MRAGGGAENGLSLISCLGAAQPEGWKGFRLILQPRRGSELKRYGPMGTLFIREHEIEGHEESGSLVLPALNHDMAAHESGQPLDQRQPEARPFMDPTL